MVKRILDKDVSCGSSPQGIILNKESWWSGLTRLA